MRCFLSLLSILTFLTFARLTLAETVQIEFTDQDSYSIKVAKIDVGDIVE